MNVVSGFGNKTEGAGAGNQVAVVTNGVDLRENIRHVRLNHRPAGTGRCHVAPVVRLRLGRLHRRRHPQLMCRRPLRLRRQGLSVGVAWKKAVEWS